MSAPDQPGNDPTGAEQTGLDQPASDAFEAAARSEDDDEELETLRERRRRRNRKSDKMPGEEVSHLNLTPMMDIMTILLVFLIISFTNDPGNINVSLSLHPPESTSTDQLEAATSVTITSEMILVNDKEVMRVADYKHQPGQQMLIPSVRDALDGEKERLQKLASLGGPTFDGSLLVIAHETTPYALIADVLWSAGQAQFSKYELVVMKAAKGETTARN